VQLCSIACVVYCQTVTFATVAPICLTFIWRFQPHVAQVPDILRLHNTAETLATATGSENQMQYITWLHLLPIDGGDKSATSCKRHANVAGNIMRQHVVVVQWSLQSSKYPNDLLFVGFKYKHEFI